MPDTEIATETAAHRADALRAAAHAKHTAAVARAEKGLRAVLKNNEPVDFRHIARTSGVSINFLYNHRELRARIESLRAQQLERTRPAPEPAEPAEGSQQAIVRVLTAKLKEERRRHHEEISQLRTELAAAHGELLKARRSVTTSASDR
jgi:uncharacterized coiled-coil DUF342 family protein